MAITDLSQMVTSVAGAMSLIAGQNGLLSVLAGIVGSGFVFLGLKALRDQASNPHGGDKTGAWSSIFFGVVLMSFWQFQGMVSDQLQLSGNILSPTAGPGYLGQMWTSVEIMLNGFGAISVFRGILLAKAAGDGSAQGHHSPAWGALWHVIGGAVMMKL